MTPPIHSNRPDLGSEEDFYAFQDALRTRGMGIVLDIVPNHMAREQRNPWWMDVLEKRSGLGIRLVF